MRAIRNLSLIYRYQRNTTSFWFIKFKRKWRIDLGDANFLHLFYHFHAALCLARFARFSTEPINIFIKMSYFCLLLFINATLLSKFLCSLSFKTRIISRISFKLEVTNINNFLNNVI